MAQNFDPTVFPVSLLTPSFARGVMDDDPINIIISALNQLAAFVGSTPRTLPNSGTQQLLSTDGFILTGTMGTNQVLVPPAVPGGGQILNIIDQVGNCGANPVTWLGTISGVVNPTLIDVAFGTAQLYWTGTQWLRLR